MGLFDRFHRKTAEPAPAAPTKATLAPFTRLVINGDVQVRLIEGAENSIGSDDGDVATLYRYDRDTLFIGGDRESTVIVGGNISTTSMAAVSVLSRKMVLARTLTSPMLLRDTL